MDENHMRVTADTFVMMNIIIIIIIIVYIEKTVAWERRREGDDIVQVTNCYNT